ncbi:hypothetical protein PanWU01x14_159740 [Parasponia andersonii]|uniref:Uncharacterized protein n=1 Tax=Parasponia andersonii TaxID=3476 RepID=A0A2P5CEN9_PARAD|nr:hypothetical protein PanWU01x14_159740 [Parasponia andersonii]
MGFNTAFLMALGCEVFDIPNSAGSNNSWSLLTRLAMTTPHSTDIFHNEKDVDESLGLRPRTRISSSGEVISDMSGVTEKLHAVATGSKTSLPNLFLMILQVLKLLQLT